MPVSKRCAAAKGREAGKRARAAAAQPAVEPEVEPEEPEEEDAAEEEPAAEKPAVEKAYLWLSPLLVALCPRVRRELEAKLSQIDAKYEAKEAERQAKCEADKEKRRLVGLQRTEELATELAERAERAERAEPVCVCVCGKCRKGGVSPLASPLGSRSVATFNAKV